MNPYKIVPMTLFDLDSISEQIDSDFETFWSYSMFQKELENPDNFYLVVKDENDMILGFGGVWQSVEDMHITCIVTHKNFRKKGIGSLILEKLIQIAKQKHMNSITLEVRESNSIAQALYLKYAFQIVGRRKKYYQGIEDAMIMTLFI